MARHRQARTAAACVRLAPAAVGAFRISAGVPGPLRLLTGVSFAALMLGMSSSPASAQLARLRANAGTVNPASAAAATSSAPLRPATMTEALARQQAMQTQAHQLAVYVQSARVAALASVSGATNVTDGISDSGLNPIGPVRSLTVYAAAGAAASSVTAKTAPSTVLAVNDVSGLNTWDGATAPVQTNSTSGAITVTITQTQANALLSWRNFDVGANTSLVYVQKLGGIAQPGWTIVNRVVNAVNPSKILGSVTADGTVLILNNAGVIFGPKAQVNLNALIASSLELGNFAAGVTSVGQTQYFVASSIADRNTDFLQNGLLVNGVGGYQGQILSALLPSGLYDVNGALPATNTGSLLVDTGASITSGDGGYIILAAPTVMNAGSLYATDGQVSLQAGMDIGAVASSGSANSVNANVRGLVLSSQVPSLPTLPEAPTPDQGIVVNYGLIQSRRGYISLGTSIFGRVENDGLLQATTSVSRNGNIALTGGTVTLDGGASASQASGIVILPDDDGETIPQGTPDSPPSFKTSQVTIGDSATSYLSTDSTQNLALFPSLLNMGANAFIFAPSANVVIGHDAATGNFALQPLLSGVDIANGATIDVAGMMAVEVAASVNSVAISPAKQNELRDTPNYRSVTTDGSFTLNGATLYVDATVSGVRADGVVYTGSPLLEAASAISQIPVTAAELMTRGGTISIDVGAQNSASNLDPAQVPAIHISSGAVLDVSGGWVTYDAGYVRSSELLTASGEAINIADADPNGSYVSVVNGFTASQPHFGISDTYYNAAIRGYKFVSAYDEGRDAGALDVIGSEISFDATLYGAAFAGSNQLAAAQAATAASSIGGDPRLLQYDKYQLSTGGLFRIGSFSGSSGIGLGQDIIAYDGSHGGDPANPAEILLDANMLSNAGLSGLMLQTSGAIAFTAGSSLTMAAGGTLEVDAGRKISFDGNIRVPGGKIVAQTYQLTSVANPGIGTVGDPFRSDDDIVSAYASGSALPSPFDITVNGMLDVSGQWTNDYLDLAMPQGAGRTNGGSISLAVAPKVFVPVGTSAATAAVAGDISGSVLLNAHSLLDVSAGGYVSTKGVLSLSGAGGNVSLVDQTTYATLAPLQVASADSFGTIVQGQGVAFAPISAGANTLGVNPSLVVQSENSVVQFAVGSIKGFGFTGGGTFKLISPDIAITGAGSATDAKATQIPLDFLSETGFGTLNLTTFNSRIVTNLFDDSSANLSAFFDTTQFVIGKGQTLNLNQTLLPNILDAATTQILRALPDGSDVTTLLTAAVPVSWYQKPANLDLNGLMELDVELGGSIIGAPLATVTTPKLYNAGTITLPGGTIQQTASLPEALNGDGFGLTDPARGGTGFAAVFGATNATGEYQVNALNIAGFSNADGSIQTNNQIFTTPGAEHFLYFLGQVAAGDGVVLTGGSTTDLAGTTIYNPVAPISPQGTMLNIGKIIDGGSILAAAAFDPTTSTAHALFSNPRYGYSSYPDPNSASATPPPQLAQIAARAIIAAPGATIAINGASATLDVKDAAGDYVSTPEWSNGGTIALLGGGTLSGAIIAAQGGSAQATGGTLEWLNPTIRASDDQSGANNVAFSDQITRSGFSTLVADGGLTLDGQFSLTLAKSLLVQSPDTNNETAVGTNAGVVISTTAGTNAAIAAPYINFSSRAGSVNSSIGGAIVKTTATFSAGASGMDLMGGILFDTSIGQVNLNSVADIRLIGVDDRAASTQEPVLDGALVAAGNITFDAARIYTTTGTGNLQRILQDRAGATDANVPSPYLLAALGDSAITFRGDHMLAVTPLSAGSYLQIEANTVNQDGYLAAPLGLIQFGTAAHPIANVNFGDALGNKSVTSVSGAGMNIPYGTTTDLTQYFFTPGTSSPLTLLPNGNLQITGTNIKVFKGGAIDGAGGGSVFAYEFVSGTGGSRDLLSRFNTDVFSSNSYNPATGVGYQYADKRQVYAIVPLAEAQKIALYDPNYAADYSSVPAAVDNGTHGPTNLYGVNAGLAVKLDGGNGIAGGQYVLMPAHYALLPGAYRIVANSGQAAPAVGSVQTMLDGSVIMGGTFSTADTAFASSQRQSFTIQSQTSFLKYSDIQTTSGTATVIAAAVSAGLASPSTPLDAARVVLDPLARLDVAGTFDLAAASGGNGSEVDILGNDIVINSSGLSADTGALALSNRTLANLGANSLMIGGERAENADDTTTLGVTATRIIVSASADLTVPELILAVAGKGSLLAVADGAQLTATGTLDQTRSGNYLIASSAIASPLGFDTSGIGSLLRISSGPQRLIDRVGIIAAANANRASTLRIGATTISGNALLIDTSNRFVVSPLARLTAPDITLSASDLSFGDGGTISAALEAKLAAATNLTLASRFAIDFAGNTPDAAGIIHPAATYAFNNLTLDTPGLGLISLTGGTDALVINAKAVRLQDTSAAGNACGIGGAPACTSTGNTLAINAVSLTFGSGTFQTYSFDGAVSLTAANGAYVEGAGSLALRGAAFNLATPFLIDRAAVVDPDLASPTPSDSILPTANYTIPVTPNYLFATSGAISLATPKLASGAATPTPIGIRAPGAQINFGTAATPIGSLSIAGVAVTATAGIIDSEATGSIALSAAASLSTPGFSRSYGDAQDITSVLAGGGMVNLVSFASDITLPAGSAISVDNGTGNAGTLNLLAAEGAVTLGATLNAGVTGPRTASLTLDSQHAVFDLSAFAKTYGQLFEGALSIRSGLGDLTLAAGDKLKSTGVAITADGGIIDIAGTIDTSGVDVSTLTGTQAANALTRGGNIALWGNGGVTLESGSLLDTHTNGYADTDLRQTSAGNITVGIGLTSGAIMIDAGASLNLGATRTLAAQALGNTGNRLVPRSVENPNTLVATTVYDYVAADTGGTLLLRAPVSLPDVQGKYTINVSPHGTVIGAGSQQIEGYLTYNLDTIAANGYYDGVYSQGNGEALDPTPSGNNILSDLFVGPDGTPSVPFFIQNFAVTSANGSNLSTFSMRPGINLVSAGDITLVNNWNLAAGALNKSAAIADGLLRPIPELGADANGNPYYAVVSGTEGNLLAHYVQFDYRVGAAASGQAGVFSFIAGGNLDVQASISDGFFNFADKSDANWINYQLGGGNRTYDPALLASCGSGLNCGNIAGYSAVVASTTANSSNTLTINLAKYSTGAQEGSPLVVAPYDDAANSATAAGNNYDPNSGNISGNALGFAQLFPILPDGTVIRSSSLRLVAGTGAVISANPLHVDRGTRADLTLEGEVQYSFASSASAVSLGSALDIKLAQNGGSATTDPIFALSSLIGNTDANGSADLLNQDSYTTINWGTATSGEPADLRQAASNFFAGQDKQFTSVRGLITGVAAPLGEMLAFLRSFTPNILSGIVANTAGYPVGSLKAPNFINFGSETAYARSLVRTGDGMIDVASARNVDLTNANFNLNNYGVAVVYRNAKGVMGSARNAANVQVGGTSIYTAGVRIAETTTTANIVGSGSAVTVTADSPYQAIVPQDSNFIPSPKGLDDQSAVAATGGGSLTVRAGGSLLALRDNWSEAFLGSGGIYGQSATTPYETGQIGDATQRWRVGSVGQDTEIAIAPEYFNSGLGALAGGNLAVTVGANVTDLTVALDTSVTTTGTAAGPVLITYGHGDLTENIGGNLFAGQVDVADGSGTIAVNGSVLGHGIELNPSTADSTGYLSVRLADATVSLTADGSIAMASVSALAAASGGTSTGNYNQAGYYTANAGFSAIATGDLDYVDNRASQIVPFQLGVGNAGIFGGSVLPPSLTLAALTDTLVTSAEPLLLYPSASGELNLFSAGSIRSLVIAMSDSDPSLLPGAFSAANIGLSAITSAGAGDVTPIQGLGFGMPGVTPTTTDALLRLYHYQGITHALDSNPVHIFAGVDIVNSLINVPKESEVIAGRDIVNLYFTGQNVNASDTTVVQAGRDILGSTESSASFNLPYVVSSDYVLGGPGSFVVQAGRNLGPFINSAVVNNVSYPGGIQTVGNLYNPSLGTAGANLTVLFGVANGTDYSMFRDAYLDPANFAQLDGSLFVQTKNALGNATSVRSEEIYAPILALWLRTNVPDAFAAIFGPTGAYPDTAAGNAALTGAAYSQSQAMYQAFIQLRPLQQDQFLLDNVYFHELQQAAEPASPSYLQYFRGYWAIDTLFPAASGYTDNLAAYTVNPSTVTADHPKGVPTRIIVDGQPEKAAQVQTGNADLRLAALETASGGNLTIVGPGGNFIAGSVVRTSTQAADRVTRFGVDPTASLAYGEITNANVERISAIPIGFEGVLTLDGGSVDSFTDGSFLVNQSRVFSEAGGDITMWSSNGDLNAGQGPRSASNFPPVTVFTTLDGYSAVDSAGSVSGAGIGAFQRSPSDPTSSVILIAPAGLVDAGDAGVRATGDVLVAAARVANADAFSAGGTISGVPARAATPSAAAPSSASSVAAAQAKTSNSQDATVHDSIITVDVLGPVDSSSANCDNVANDPHCKPQKSL